eukprot:TCONS_00060409-protein
MQQRFTFTMAYKNDINIGDFNLLNYGILEDQFSYLSNQYSSSDLSCLNSTQRFDENPGQCLTNSQVNNSEQSVSFQSAPQSHQNGYNNLTVNVVKNQAPSCSLVFPQTQQTYCDNVVGLNHINFQATENEIFPDFEYSIPDIYNQEFSRSDSSISGLISAQQISNQTTICEPFQQNNDYQSQQNNFQQQSGTINQLSRAANGSEAYHRQTRTYNAQSIINTQFLRGGQFFENSTGNENIQCDQPTPYQQGQERFDTNERARVPETFFD